MLIRDTRAGSSSSPFKAAQPSVPARNRNQSCHTAHHPPTPGPTGTGVGVGAPLFADCLIWRKANFSSLYNWKYTYKPGHGVRAPVSQGTGQGGCYCLQRDVPRSLGNILGLSDWREADLAFKQIYTQTHTKGRERAYRFSKRNALRRGRRKVFTFFASGSINVFSFLICICLYSHLCMHSKPKGQSSTAGLALAPGPPAGLTKDLA